MKTTAQTIWDDQSLQKVGMQSLLDLFNDSCAGMMAVDTEARVAWINDKYLALLGLPNAGAALGKPVEEIIPNSRLREVVKTGKAIFLDIMRIKDQSLVVMRLPLRDDSGRLTGALGFTLYDKLERLKPLVSKFTGLEAELAQTKKELANLRRSKYSLTSFIGISPASLELKRKARKAAQLDTAVLLLGETGTGKELLAQGIHAASMRNKNAFVAINVAAVPETLLEAEFFGVAPGAYTGADVKGREGKFKIADGGTLFLDEVGDMPLHMQAKLLRVLQEQEIEPLGTNRVNKVDVRVIAATSRNLKQMVADGTFRSDLYYRLNVIPIILPPLRERLEDIDALCEHLLEQIAERRGLSLRELTHSGRAALAAYNWPGNVRELHNVLEQATMQTDDAQLTAESFAEILRDVKPLPSFNGVLSNYKFQYRTGAFFTLPGAIHDSNFPAQVDASSLGKQNAPSVEPLPAQLHNETAEPIQPLHEAVAELEKNLIISALNECSGNKTLAARLMKISRATLYQKMEAYKLT